jgi:hypothetical protein
MPTGHPALDYPVFGLASGWEGPRWLWFLEGSSGDPVWGVWLAHSCGQLPEAAHPRMLIAKMPAQRYGELMAPSRDLAGEIALSALLRLFDVVTPDLGDEE